MDKTRRNWMPKQIFYSIYYPAMSTWLDGLAPILLAIERFSVELGSSSLQKSEDVSQMNLECLKATIKCLFIMFQMIGGSVS